MHRKIDRGREAGKHARLQAVSQSGRHPCMQPGMHTNRERDRCPQTGMQPETYLEIHTETEVHRVGDR